MLRPEAVSLAIREISPAGADEKVSAEFFSFLQRERIAPQYILYDKEDILHFRELLERGIIPDENISVLLVLGRYAKTSNQKQRYCPSALHPSGSPTLVPLRIRLPARPTACCQAIRKAVIAVLVSRIIYLCRTAVRLRITQRSLRRSEMARYYLTVLLRRRMMLDEC